MHHLVGDGRAEERDLGRVGVRVRGHLREGRVRVRVRVRAEERDVHGEGAARPRVAHHVLVALEDQPEEHVVHLRDRALQRQLVARVRVRVRVS